MQCIILFDLDGTLTDPGVGITNSVMYALKKFGIEETDRTKLYPFIGPPLLNSFMDFYGFDEQKAEEAVGVLFGYGSREELTKAGADRLIERPEEMHYAVEKIMAKGSNLWNFIQ